MHRNGLNAAAVAIVAMALWSTGSMADTKLAEGLMDKAEADGVVRVIVEAQASDPEAVASAGPGTRGVSANVESARLLLMNSLPADAAPFAEPLGDGGQIVMEVTADGLRALAASPLVARVVLDGLDAPQPVRHDGSDEDGAVRRDGLDAPQ